MSSEVLFEIIENKLDDALLFIVCFKTCNDVLGPRFKKEKKNYLTLLMAYNELLKSIGEVDKTTYTIAFRKNPNTYGILPIVHKIEKNVKTEKDDDE